MATKITNLSTQIHFVQLSDAADVYPFNAVGNYVQNLFIYGSPATSNMRRDGDSLKFPVNNIPNGYTVNSATLRLYGGVHPAGSPFGMTIKAKNQQTPSIPSIFQQITNPYPIVTGTWGSKVTTTWTNVVTHPFLPTYSSENLPHDVNVTNLVKELVASYDYTTSKPMMFFVNAPTAGGGPSVKNVMAGIAIIQSTLTIDYSEPSGPSQQDKTTYVFK